MATIVKEFNEEDVIVMKKWIYEFLYRFPFVPIDLIFGSTADIEKLVESAIQSRLTSGRALTLGCGVGRETIYLKKKGFDVIGTDFSPTAIKKARRRAEADGVEVDFIQDDITNLNHISGVYDFITDIGLLNDLNQEARELYMQNVLPLTRPGTFLLLMCFENKLPAKEVEKRFGHYFTIVSPVNEPGSGFPSQIATYLMTRNTEAL